MVGLSGFWRSGFRGFGVLRGFRGLRGSDLGSPMPLGFRRHLLAASGFGLEVECVVLGCYPLY